MASDEVHVAQLCSTLYGFDYTKDTDVTIYCEGRQFLCHRAVLAAKSTYFECMFRSEWIENVTGSVTFAGDHMQADTLLEVLKYFYAGSKSINAENFVDLLYAGDYLGVHGLEADCIRKLSEVGTEPIDDLWEALFSPHSIFNKSLISVLASCNLTERLKRFFNAKEFLLISADTLEIMVTKLWRAPPPTNNILLDAIHRWRTYARNERKEHALKLHKLLKPNSKKPFKLCGISSKSFSRVGSEFVKMLTAVRKPSLYVYALDWRTNNTSYTMKTYRYCGEKSSRKKFVLEHCYPTDLIIRDLRFVSVDNVGLFCITNGDREDYADFSVFHQFTSEDIHPFQSGLSLAPQPMDTSLLNFELCNLSDRGLYLLNTRYDCPTRPPRRNLNYDASKQEFSDEEVRRGLFFFNIELDRWLPVPPMRSRPQSACMTVLDNNMVFVIAGHGNGKIVQAYDHRMSQWQLMKITKHHHVKPQSCVLDGSIYVSSLRHCERYDPVADRWEDIRGFRGSNVPARRLMSYKNELWHLWRNYGTNIDVYEPRTATWSTKRSVFYPSGPKDVLDAVIW